MIIVPGMPPLQQTRHSRELGRKVEQLVRDYQRENPDVTESDVHSALAQLTTPGESPGVARQRRVLGVVIGALAAVAFGVMASTDGGRFENNTTVFRIIGALAAIFAIAIAAVRLARRS